MALFLESGVSPPSCPHRAAASGTSCGGARTLWCSMRVEACSNSSHLTLGHFILHYRLWPGPGLGCPRREADPCPSSLSSVHCPTPLPAPHLQRQWSFLVPSKQAVTGMPGPISRSQALILCLCPSVRLSVSLLLVTG